jgi:hypothetical protein
VQELVSILFQLLFFNKNNKLKIPTSIAKNKMQKSQKICAGFFLVMWLGFLGVTIFLIINVWTKYETAAKQTDIECYNPNKINEYGDKHPTCDTILLNGTRFVHYEKTSLCKNHCMKKDCITTAKIHVIGGKVRMNQCYQDIQYTFFSDNCVQCYRPNKGDTVIFTLAFIMAFILLTALAFGILGNIVLN